MKRYRPPVVVSAPIAEVEKILAPYYRSAAEKWQRDSKASQLRNESATEFGGLEAWAGDDD